MTWSRPTAPSLLVACLLSSLVGASLRAQDEVFRGGQRPGGRRVPWTASRIRGSPEPPSPYLAERAFPRLKFVEPLELVPLPGTGRLVVAEHAGRIYSFPNQPECERPDLMADFKSWNPEVQEVYSVAFHPGFATNRQVFVWYILKPELPDGTRIGRFTLRAGDPPQLDLGSGQVVFTWKSGGHNGGAMRFGPDGYLYISTGDGAGPDPPDPLNTGQNLDDVLSCVLRIDVDRPEAGRAYGIPRDNPFVGVAGARGEIWAYGFRNPWRMNFDAKTGELWVADVGWELWEMVYRVERGGNYGWSITEGTQQPVKPEGRRGPTPILPPVIEHPHSEAASITGGLVYRGERLPELRGAYVYGDWVTGKIWELRHDGVRVTRSRELVDTPYKIVSFGEDHQGDLLVVDQDGGLYRLKPNPAAGEPSTFPRRLSETGLFASLKDLEPAPGVMGYSIEAGMWRDGAVGERVVGVPGGGSILVQTNDGRWVPPADTVLAKTYSLEMEMGNPRSRRRVETQVLHFNGQDWNAYSYRWSDAGEEAELVAAGGEERALSVRDPAAPGGVRRQTWRFHSRAECLRCHNQWGNYALGFQAQQVTRRSLDQLVRAAVLAPEALSVAPPVALVDPYGADGEVALRARSWLHVNCAHCHRFGAGGSGAMRLDLNEPLEKSALIGARAQQGDFGLPGSQLVAGGDPFRSVLFYRVSKLGKGHMPYVGARMVDERGLEVLRQWIAGMPATPVSDAALQDRIDRQRRQEDALLDALAGGASSAMALQVETLLSSPRGALALLTAVASGRLPAETRALAVGRGTGHAEGWVRELFERHVPEEQRVRTLGPDIQSGMILGLRGDAARGARLFGEGTGLQCVACHRVNGVGREFGPDLSRLGTKYPDPARLLEQILQPSKVVDPKYQGYLVERSDGTELVALVVERSDRELVLRTSTAEALRIPRGEVTRVEPQGLSLMPEGLLQGLTAQEAADLLAYLASLK